VGIGEGARVGEGLILGESEGDCLGEGLGVGVGVGLGVGVGVGLGEVDFSCVFIDSLKVACPVGSLLQPDISSKIVRAIIKV